MLDQRAEHPTPAGEVADHALRLIVHPGGQELLELGALLVQDPQRRVARARDLPRRLQHAIEDDAEVQLGDQFTSDIEQPANPSSLCG